MRNDTVISSFFELGGKGNHLAQQIGVRALCQKRTKVHLLVGHGVTWNPVAVATLLYDKSPMAARLRMWPISMHVNTPENNDPLIAVPL